MNSQVETPQSTESYPSDLNIPLGDTTSMGTPPEKVTTPPDPPLLPPLGQNRNQDIVPETPRYSRHDHRSPDRYGPYVRVGQYVLFSQEECSILRLYYVVLSMHCNYL